MRFNTSTWELGEKGVYVPIPLALVIALALGGAFAVFLPAAGILLVAWHGLVAVYRRL
jgi:hypothetical protein